MHAQPHEPERRPSPNDAGRAERRRRALRDFMHKEELKPADLARLAGFSTPNAIYNFLNGRTAQLSQETYEKLAAAVPGATVENLTGTATFKAPRAARGVVVRAEARAGAVVPSFDMPLEDQREVQVPVDAASRAAGAFAVVVASPGMDQVYPDKTVLVCLPFAQHKSLESGKRVVVQRQVGEGVEVSVRELQVREGKAHLWFRSEDPDYATPIPMPWPYSGQPWKKGDDVFLILGVVIMACMPEA